MSATVISRKLQDLTDAWFDEKAHFERINNRYQASVKNLSSLNSQIWNQCQKEGVDISTLNLNKDGDS